MKIVFLDLKSFQRENEVFDFSGLKKLGEFISFDEIPCSRLEEHARGADVLITVKNKLTVEHFNLLPSVKLDCKSGSSCDGIDVSAANQRGIAVGNLPGYDNSMVGQWT